MECRITDEIVHNPWEDEKVKRDTDDREPIMWGMGHASDIEDEIIIELIDDEPVHMITESQLTDLRFARIVIFNIKESLSLTPFNSGVYNESIFALKAIDKTINGIEGKTK